MLSRESVYDEILKSEITILIEDLEVHEYGKHESEDTKNDKSKDLSEAEDEVQDSS